jgi:hypothetical protein
MRKLSILGLAFGAVLGFSLPAYAESPTRICQYAIGANGQQNCIDVGPAQTLNGLTTVPLWVQMSLGGVAVSNSNPIPVTVTSGGGATSQPVGSANLSTGQVSVGATATQIVAARTGTSGTGRISVTVVNAGTTPIYLGGSGVTTTTGTLLPGIVGASVTINTQAAVYGTTASGSQTVSEFETF